MIIDFEVNKLLYILGVLTVLGGCDLHKKQQKKYYSEISKEPMAKSAQNQRCYEGLGYSVFDVALDILEHQNGKDWLDTVDFSFSFMVSYDATIIDNDTVLFPSQYRFLGKGGMSLTEERFFDSLKKNEKAQKYLSCIAEGKFGLYIYGMQLLRVTMQSNTAYKKYKSRHNYLMGEALRKRKVRNRGL